MKRSHAKRPTTAEQQAKARMLAEDQQAAIIWQRAVPGPRAPSGSTALPWVIGVGRGAYFEVLENGTRRYGYKGRTLLNPENGKPEHYPARGRPARTMRNEAREAQRRHLLNVETVKAGASATPQQVAGRLSGAARSKAGVAGLIRGAAARLTAAGCAPRRVAAAVVAELATAGREVSARYVRKVLRQASSATQSATRASRA